MTKIKETVSKVKTDISGKWVSIEEVEKLAVLVVRECALQCVHNEDMDLIEKHFEIEE